MKATVCKSTFHFVLLQTHIRKVVLIQTLAHISSCKSPHYFSSPFTSLHLHYYKPSRFCAIFSAPPLVRAAIYQNLLSLHHSRDRASAPPCSRSYLYPYVRNYPPVDRTFVPQRPRTFAPPQSCPSMPRQFGTLTIFFMHTSTISAIREFTSVNLQALASTSCSK